MAVNAGHKHANGRSLFVQFGNLFGTDFEMYTYSCFGTVHCENFERETVRLIIRETEEFF
jgi:hypothetical protein